jgi:serine protease inhibitor
MRFTVTPLIGISAVLAVTFAHVSCATTGGAASDRSGAELGGYSSFGIDLYKQLLEESPGVNIFISPTSIGFALAMTYNGSVGETRDAMARTLKFSDTSLEAVNVADSTLISAMNDTLAGIRLSIANSLWAREGIAFNESFLRRNARYYGAEIQSLDFSSPRASEKINGWVAEKTNNRITKIVDGIDGSAILFLINAIYFKGSWTVEFDKSMTRERAFHLLDGGEKSHPMMERSDRFAYFKGDEFQAVRLPYGDGRIGMYVFLPDGGSSLERFHAELSSDAWNAWMRRFESRRGRVVLPRFKLQYEAKLKRALSALGMGIAFDGGRANFTGMVKAAGANAYIHDVAHKTFVDVNEEGTEAAAVTSVEMRVTSALPAEKPFEMIVDRPFFVAIVDGETGLILFAGSIVNPE